ncbi:MAG TPA: HD domain-containing protein [Patescibacteria group bacterium]|nr:HD domain-containing protein [Patescibacteria group bacterium]
MSQKKTDPLNKLAGFLYEVGTLRKIPRAHMQSLLTHDLSDNIASHSHRVSVIGWFLAHEEGADPYKTVSMCLFHDISEARSGDQNWLHKRYVKVFEDEIARDQTSGLPKGNGISELIKEYRQRKTKEAILVKDADLLDQILLIKEYILQGNKEAEAWLKNGKGDNPNTHAKMLRSKTAKKLAKEIVRLWPGDWWKNLWTETRR